MDVKFDTLFANYKPILQLLIDSSGQSLECLCIPSLIDYNDETFPQAGSLPSLKHMRFSHTTSQVTKNFLSACPSLEYFRSRTSFTGWQILPKGFQKLQSDCEDLDGMFNLLSSPAVQSLEFVRNFLMTSDINYQSYHFSCLKELEVTIDSFVTNCLTHLARILSFAPVLRELKIHIAVFDEIQSQVWINVLSECEAVTSLTVYLYEPIDTENPRIDVSSWQDDFAKTIVSKIKKLEYLNIHFHFSSDGLRLLSQLENLQYFHQRNYTKNISYDSVFDTDALTDFLSSSLDRKLKEYIISIPFGEYLILKESFLDFVEQMEKKHNLIQFYVGILERHLDKERTHPDKIPGMIHVTNFFVTEWDFICPYIEDDDKDDDTRNLLIAVTDTQSHVQDIFLSNE